MEYGSQIEQQNINRQNNNVITIKIIVVIFFMKVKLFDENHELDLEKSINKFLESNDVELIDIKYQVALNIVGEEQIFCFSAMIIYSND